MDELNNNAPVDGVDADVQTPTENQAEEQTSVEGVETPAVETEEVPTAEEETLENPEV